MSVGISASPLSRALATINTKLELTAQMVERIDLFRLESLASRMDSNETRALRVLHIPHPWDTNEPRPTSDKTTQVKFFRGN